MNAGAREARGEILLFLHADTSLPNGALETIQKALADPQIVGGRFEVELDSSRPIFQTIAYFINILRSRPDLIATGDQAVFVRRKTFSAMDGYPEIPLMEDVEFIARGGAPDNPLDVGRLASPLHSSQPSETPPTVLRLYAPDQMTPHPCCRCCLGGILW
jgi:hypothetical protein